MTTLDRLCARWGCVASGRMPIDVPGIGRDDLAEVFRDLGFTAGAEIGVERGHYARTLCRLNPDLSLMAVDPWRAYRGYREHVSQEKLDGFYAETQQRLEPYRCDVRRAFSVEAADSVAPQSLDFVFIDGNHQLEHVVADLAAWVPTVRPGGIVAGHDYQKRKGEAPFHVPYAVHAWTGAYRISPWFVLRGDRSPTWLWVQT